MAAKLATADERILARMEEAAAIRAGSIIARGSSDKPQAGGMQFDCGIPLTLLFITDPELTIDKNYTIVEGRAQYEPLSDPDWCRWGRHSATLVQRLAATRGSMSSTSLGLGSGKW